MDLIEKCQISLFFIMAKMMFLIGVHDEQFYSIMEISSNTGEIQLPISIMKLARIIQSKKEFIKLLLKITKKNEAKQKQC